MATAPKYFDPQTLARLQGLRLRARHVVEGFVAGLHRSPFRGYSIEFSEHRDYAPGDDLRYVDWKVLARSDRFVVKQFEDETNLVCHLLLDVSDSMRYQSADAAMSKLEYAQCVAAVLSYLVLLGQDGVSVMTLDSAVRDLAPVTQSRESLQMLLDTIETPDQPDFQPAARPDLSLALHEAAERLTRRGVVILLSDLLDDPKRLLSALTTLRRQKHDVIVMYIHDPAEHEFPFDRPTVFHGMEGLGDLQIDARRLKPYYLDAVQEHYRSIEQGCLAAGIDFEPVPTDTALDDALANYLSRRAQRVR